MKAGLYTIESSFDSGRIGDVSVDELDLAREIFTRSARKIVEYSHRVPVLHQRIHQMRAQEPRATSHEYASHRVSSKELRKTRLVCLVCSAG
jgi:hypothetical protein